MIPPAISPARLPQHSPASQPDDLRKAAEAFEAIILRQMLATMRSTTLGDDLLGSSATNQFSELADARTADTLAARGAFGIAALVERQLRQQRGSGA